MGMALELGDAGPHLPSPIRSAADVEKLAVPDPEERLGYVTEAIRVTRRALAGRVPLIGFCGAPFTLASYMIEGGGGHGFTTTKRLFFEEPRVAHALLDKITSTLCGYVTAQVRAGAQAIQVFDSWGGELSPADFGQYSAPYLARIVAAVKEAGAPVILFATPTCGLLERLANLEPDVVGIDWRTNIEDARRRIGREVAVQGNLDPCALFCPDDELRRRIAAILAHAGPQPGHIFNLGHGILPPTSPAKAKLMVDTVHELSRTARTG
jgi:uroporphyrinogen decarboxylase